MKFLVHTGKYLWFLTVLLGCTATALCYTPDGSLSNDLSCDPTANESICCEMGFSCTSSRFCLKEGHANSSGLAFDGVYIRGTCTDSSWASAECGGNCVKGNPAGGENVQYCGGGRFCCGNSNKCCAGPDTILNLGEPKIYAVAGVYSTDAPASTSATTSAPASGSELPAAASKVDEKPVRDGDKALVVGIAVGVSLGVALIAVVIGGLFWIRKLKKDMFAALVDGRRSVDKQQIVVELDGSDVRRELDTKHELYMTEMA